LVKQQKLLKQSPKKSALSPKQSETKHLNPLFIIGSYALNRSNFIV